QERTIADPYETFYRRCFIAFESDEAPVYRMWDLYENVGIWSSDYPHHDAEDAWEALELMAKFGVPEPVQKKLLGENARRLYGIGQADARQPPQADEVGAQRQRLHDVGAALEGAVHDDARASRHRLDDLRQHVGRAPAVVELAAAVVGDVDDVHAVLAGDRR